MSDTPRRADLLAAEIGGRLSDCPPAEVLQSLADGELSPDGRGRAEAHLERCDACRAAADYLAAEALPAEETPPAEVVRASDLLIDAVRGDAQTGGQTRVPQALRAAAMVTVALALGVLAWVWWPERLDTDLGELRGGHTLQLLAPVGLLDAVPAEIRWTPVGDADGYRVLLFDDAMEPIWERRVEGNADRLTLDDEARSGLETGRRYTIQVVPAGSWGEALDDAASAHFSISAGGTGD